MQRTYRVPLGRAGLAGLVAALVLLCLPGTSIAGGPSDASHSLDAQSGLLQYGAGYGKARGTPPVRVVQRTLRRLGWQPGPVDGLYGPRTKAAVTRFQSAARVAVDGVVGPQTRRALTRASREPLRRGVGFAQPDGSPRVRALQQALRRDGLRPGPVDGLFGPRTEAAVERLQRSRGIPVSGVAAAQTQRLLATAPGQADGGGADPTAPDPDRPDVEGTRQVATGGQVEGGDSGDVAVPLAVLIGAAALLVGLLAGALLGRRNRVVSGTAVPLAEGVMAEGTSHARAVGRFRGTVHALVLGRSGLRRAPEARYLVSDPAKHDPFWVSQEEVSNIVPPTRTPRPADRVRALGYISVPVNGELQSAAFDSQLDAIDSYCDEQGWELVEVIRDVDIGVPDVERRGLLYALEKIGRGEASCIVVSELGRLSDTAADLGRVLDRLERSDGRLVALDLGLDTASPAGRVAAQALTSVSSWEHARRSRGLAVAATVQAQVVQDVPALKQRIATMRAAGMTLQAIADVLNSEGVPTLRGGAKWRPSSVQSATGYRRPPKRQQE